MDVILDTKSYYYKMAWEMFFKGDAWQRSDLLTKVVLIDCNGLSKKEINKKLEYYKGTIICLVNTPFNQAYEVAAVFNENVPLSSIASALRIILKVDTLEKEDQTFTLSSKEISIVKMLSSGFTNKEISSCLRMPLSTTKYYLQKIYKKMNVSNRTEAALASVKINL